MSYKVSIVIPIYNVEQYIERCLLSAFNQTFSSIEYLIVDDRGGDRSMEIALDIIESHKRKNDIRIITHQKNEGPGAARNTGIANASGIYIYFMDSDDEVSLDAIEKLYNAVNFNDSDIAVGSYISFDYANSGQKWEWIFKNDVIKGEEYAVANYYLKGNYYVMSWNKIYRKDLLLSNNIRCIDNNIHEDVFFSLQVAMTANSIVTVSDITYFYSFRPGSTMHLYKEKNFLDYYETIKQIILYVEHFKRLPIYNKLVYYIYGFRYSILWELNNSSAVSENFKADMSVMLGVPILSIWEIWTLNSVNPFHKIKYFVSFLPYQVQLVFLRLVTKFSRKLK